MRKKIQHYVCGCLTRREFMYRAGMMALAPSALAAPMSLKEVTPRDFFPGSGIPETLRERLANRLLGDLRVTDPAFDDYYQQMAQVLSPGDDYLIVTAGSDDINAFAHYGGLVIMMRGMWRFADNEDALLGIVAHEMGHVKLNHFESRKKLNDQISAISVPLLIAGLLAGSAEVRESIIVGGSGIITGQIYGHSRELEHEADVVGLKMLTRSGRDGREMSALLGRLAGATNEYVSTHPAPLRRSAYIKNRLLSGQQTPPRNSAAFLILREKLAAASGGSKFIQNKQKALKDADADESVAYQVGIMLVAAKGGNRKLGDEMELELSESSHPFVSAARADYVSRGGDHLRALNITAEARESYPQSAALAVQQVASLRRAKEHREVIKLQKSLPRTLSERPDILRETAQSALVLGMNAQANIFLARAHIRGGEFELAQRQLDIAARDKMDTKMLVETNKLRNIIKRELSAMAAKKG